MPNISKTPNILQTLWRNKIIRPVVVFAIVLILVMPISSREYFGKPGYFGNATARYSDAPMELTDSWEKIAAAGRDGTYQKKYRIGDTKELDLGSEGVITMRLAAMDADELADGSGKAPMTWIADELLKSDYSMNNRITSFGGWEESRLRYDLQNNVLPLMAPEISSKVREVKKNSYDYIQEKAVETNDTIWIPSVREVMYADQSDFVEKYFEEEGVAYTIAFPDEASRKRSRDGETKAWWWWLRSTVFSTYFYFVSTSGSCGNYGAEHEGGVVIGFCL